MMADSVAVRCHWYDGDEDGSACVDWAKYPENDETREPEWVPLADWAPWVSANVQARNDAILDAAREVARLCHPGSNEIDFDYVSTIAKDALSKLAEILDEDDDATTDDPWTLHGEARATLRADGEREERR